MRTARLVLDLPPDAVEDVAVAERGGLVAALCRQQQEAHQAAVILRHLARAELAAGFPDRRDLRLGQHALALLLRRAPDRRDEVGRDQIFLRRPAQHRAERAEQAVGGAWRAGLDQCVADVAQIGFGELDGGQRR